MQVFLIKQSRKHCEKWLFARVFSQFGKNIWLCPDLNAMTDSPVRLDGGGKKKKTAGNYILFDFSHRMNMRKRACCWSRVKIFSANREANKRRALAAALKNRIGFCLTINGD